MAAGRGSSPVLVGRAEQLAALAGALADARQGGHQALLIGGEAGVGKSRLLAEFAATAPDARVLTAGCLQLGGDELPFTPFAAVLRGLVRELGTDKVAAIALELSPPTLHQSGLQMRLAFVALARGQVEAAAEALSAARQALSDVSYQDQYHLPLAELAVRVRLAADGPAAGLEEAIEVTERHDLSGTIPTHGWPLAVALAHAGLTALRYAVGAQEEAPAERSAMLLHRLRTLSGALADGPLQRAYRLTFRAQVCAADGSSMAQAAGTRLPRPGRRSSGPMSWPSR
jgi:hypothetical protein